MNLDRLISPTGSIGRRQYLLYGVTLVALKFNLDRLISTQLFNETWGFSSYLSPIVAIGAKGDWQRLAALLVLAIPFMWIGLCLTAQRLRSLAAPTYLLALFFVPLVNLVFFAILSAIPPDSEISTESSLLERYLPRSAFGCAVAGIAVSVLTGCALAAIMIKLTELYGWGLFIGIPFMSGFVASTIAGYRSPQRLTTCAALGLFTVALMGFALFLFLIEGVVCILMAAPIGLILGALGGTLAYFFQHRVATSQLAVLPILLVSLTWAEQRNIETEELIEVSTSVDVDAPPPQVWKHVVSFSQIPEPTDWLFNSGIAYPIRARIDGNGVGAIRYCEFSTGPFVEPITVWDQPNRLEFSVSAQPPPMREMSWYPNIHPPHLDNFLVSQRGRFLLQALPRNRTRLIGTTWYRHRIWPVEYWRMFSDQVIHAIHLRVLQHVKAEAERTAR